MEMRVQSVVRIVVCLLLGTGAWTPATAEKVIVPVASSVAGPVVPVVPSRVLGPVNDTPMVTLVGNTYPSARPKNDLGLVDPGMRLEKMVLVLKRSAEQEKALAAFNERQYDPKSPDFHRWLHADEFGQLYGPSEADIAAVTNWLQNHGFTIDLVSRGRVTIEFSGNVAQVQEAFHLEMHRYFAEGKAHISNDRDPQIPAALSPVVTGIASLNDFFPRHYSHPGNFVKRDLTTGKYSFWNPGPSSVTKVEDAAKQGPNLLEGTSQREPGSYTANISGVRPEFGYTDASTGYQREELSPYDVATIYNILPLWNASTPINGTGVRVAIVGLSDVEVADFNTYRSSFGLPASTLVTLHSGADPGIVSDSQGENTEDTEMVSATAPGATVVLVSDVDNATTNGLVTAVTYIVDNAIAPILTMSYGQCELKNGTANNSLFNQIFQQAATAGISSFVASGDSGSGVCTTQNGTPPYGDTFGLAVSGMASTPYVTAVGGTDLQWPFVEGTTPSSTYWNTTNDAHGASAKGYMPEMSWNATCSDPLLLNVYTSYSSVEALCNAAISGSPGLVEMAGGSGGVSACTSNSTTSNSTTFDPTSCSGGYAKPSWQTGVIGIPADGKRDLPDVSMFASYGFGSLDDTGIPGSALLVCESFNSPENSCDYSNPSYIIYQENGGTSAASPMTAGVMALIVQKTGAMQGLANPVFYSLAAKENYSTCNSNTVKAGNSCIFYDTTTGSNAMNCGTGDPNCVTNTTGDVAGILSGYPATTGYDLTTGLGTFNVTNLVNAWPTTATAPAVTLTPTSLTFPSTPVGTTNATTQAVTVKNTGTAAASITNIAVSGGNYADFSGTGTTTTCSTTTALAVGAACTVTIAFDPSAAGARSSTLVVTDNAGSGTQSATLSGTGAAAATLSVSLSPTTLAFASTTVGSTTVAQVVTVKNTGTGAVTLTSETLTGTGAASFLISANTCTASLAAGASCAVSVEFKPASAATFAANLSVADNATGSPQTVALSGTGTAAAGGGTLTVTPASLTFASTTVGSVTAAQQVILKNTGTTTVTFTGFTYSGANTSSFVQSGINCGTTIAAGASCAVAIEFKPAAAGALTAALNIADNATGSPQTVTLSGTGVASGSGGTLTVTPASLTFASTTVGSVTAAQQVIVKNTGTATVTFTGFTYTGANTSSFVQSGINCGTTIAAGASCAVAIEFKPAVAGALAATLNIADNATGSPQTVALSGTGVTAGGSGTLTITPASLSLSYATTAVGSVTAAQQVILKNTGSTAITLSGFTYTGTNTSSFVQSGINCGTSLAAGAACAVAIEFKPQSAGALTATLNIADSATGSPQKVTLSGTGTGGTAATVTLSPTSLAFPNTIIGSTSDAQVVTLTNTGSAAVTISSITLGGSSPASYLDLSNCGTSLAASASCSIYVAFKPATAAALAATLSVADSATGSPQTVALTGTGTAAPSVKLSATSLTFGTVAHGTTSAAQMLTLTNSGTATLTLTSITLGGTGAADFEALDTCGATLAPAASCTVYVAFKPAAAAAYTATLSIADNGSASPQSVALSGTGN